MLTTAPAVHRKAASLLRGVGRLASRIPRGFKDSSSSEVGPWHSEPVDEEGTVLVHPYKTLDARGNNSSLKFLDLHDLEMGPIIEEYAIEAQALSSNPSRSGDNESDDEFQRTIPHWGAAEDVDSDDEIEDTFFGLAENDPVLSASDQLGEEFEQRTVMSRMFHTT